MSISYTEINPNSKIFPNQVCVGVDRNDYPKVPVMNLTSAGWKSNEQLEADVMYLMLLSSEQTKEEVEPDLLALNAYYIAGVLSDERLEKLVTKSILTEEQKNFVNGTAELSSEPAESGQHTATTVVNLSGAGATPVATVPTSTKKSTKKATTTTDDETTVDGEPKES